MNGRRLLGDTLAEIAGSVLDMPGRDPLAVRVTSLELDLPIDLRLARSAGEPQLVGDVPLFHLRTDFDPPPARFQVTCVAIPADPELAEAAS